MDFEKLYHAYFMKIYSYVMTIVKNPDEAEEITQEVFFKAMTTKNQFQGKSSEYTWLCAIAKRTAFDELKKQKRKSESELIDDIPSENDFLKSIENHDTVIKIHEHLHAMEEPYKEVFQLRVFGELSFAEIGAIFQKTENWARVTYHRARLKLQERVKGDSQPSVASLARSSYGR